MKGKLLVLFLLVQPHALFAHDQDDRPIREGTELRDWCRSASEAELIGRGGTPSNWSARYWDQGDVLNVEGQWRSGEQRWQVQCRVARGAQARFATMSLNPASN
jgi:hypothetical protein